MQLSVIARKGEGCATKTTAFVVVDVFNCIQLHLKSSSHNEIKIDSSIIIIIQHHYYYFK